MMKGKVVPMEYVEASEEVDIKELTLEEIREELMVDRVSYPHLKCAENVSNFPEETLRAGVICVIVDSLGDKEILVQWLEENGYDVSAEK